ncbi:Uncharacterised protein [Trueperella bialowiezensis]|uniref:Uncharacterized protein n=1 Tax=Trueperella bialowiezensis TaxID=312285 RepID=A0A448PFE0_9ACTO|nr:Uncharacterised protein [Trueperella bialowiezensis]
MVSRLKQTLEQLIAAFLVLVRLGGARVAIRVLGFLLTATPDCAVRRHIESYQVAVRLSEFGLFYR